MFIAVVIGVAVWGGAIIDGRLRGQRRRRGRGPTHVHGERLPGIIFDRVRGTLSATPINDTSEGPGFKASRGATADINDIQPGEIAWHSFTPTQVLYADPRLEYRGRQKAIPSSVCRSETSGTARHRLHG